MLNLRRVLGSLFRTFALVLILGTAPACLRMNAGVSVTVPPTAPLPRITDSNPTSSLVLSLSYTSNPDTDISYEQYCILENNTSEDDCSWITGTPPRTFSVSASEGEKVLSIWVRNAGGEVSPRVDTDPITLDLTGPVIDSAGVSNASPTNARTFGLTFGEISETYSQYCILENNVNPGSCSWISEALPASFDVTASDGDVVLSLWLKDAAGNVSARLDTPSVTLDTTPPVLSSAAVSNSSPTNTRYYGLVLGAVSETYSDYCILENDTTESSCSWTGGTVPSEFQVSFLSDTKVLSIWLRDAAGNVSSRVDSNPVTYEAPPPQPVLISGGVGFSCSRLSSGSVKCWGNNGSGQLGDGTTTYRIMPVTVSGISTATQVATGQDHACAVLADTTVKCWGGNGNGQLGDGTTTNRTTPVTVTGLTGVTQVTAGYYYTCASLSGGSAKCWGTNGFGQLGDGTSSQRKTPASVSGISNLARIETGVYHTCAVLSDGTAKCWGYAENGLGDAAGSTMSMAPVTVSGISSATEIGVGDAFACAVLAEGTVRCWGKNTSGRLGDGTTTHSLTPVVVSGLTGVTRIAVGGFHACALLSNGTMRCWGFNYYGQLGDGTSTDSTTPVSVSGISTALQITGGYTHTCASLADDSKKCWGWNALGGLGDGTTTDRFSPVSVTGL